MRGRCDFYAQGCFKNHPEPSWWGAGARGAAKVTKAYLKSERGKVVEMNFKGWSMVEMWLQVV